MNTDSINTKGQMEQKHVLVSVVCTAYNHEPYISEALDGFLMQKTDFPIEIIITDDKSTDGTANILKEYESKYPNLFKIFYHKENLYSKKINFFQNEILPNCSGQYIAFCEGDDYWTDPDKLQIQVDFMERNPEFSICCHEVIINNEITKRKRLSRLNNKATLTFHDIVETPLMHTVSILYRRVLLQLIPDWFNGLIVGDFPLILYLAQQGKIRYFPEPMAVYRIHSQGTWEKQSYDYKREGWIDMLKVIKDKYIDEINIKLTGYYYNGIWSLLMKAQIENDSKRITKYTNYILEEGEPAITFFSSKTKFLYRLNRNRYLKSIYRLMTKG